MTTTTGPNVDPLAALRAVTVVAVLRAPTAEAGIRATAALVAGGVTGIEITYSTPDAAAVIREVRAQHGDGVYLGAGTVLKSAQAAEAVEAGAEFLVSPGTEPKLAAAMLDTGAIVLSGALTPSEVMATLACGVHVVKLFPASLGGPAYLKALAGAVPGRRLRADRWRRRGQPRRLAGGGRGRPSEPAGTCARPRPWPAGDWDTITATARRYSAAARSGPGSSTDDPRSRRARTWASSGSAPAARPSGRCSRSGPTPCSCPPAPWSATTSPLDSPAPVYREVVEAIRDDPQHWGALVTTHKIGRATRRLATCSTTCDDAGRDVR